MKVRVSMPGAYMAVEMEPDQACKTFQKMTEILCLNTKAVEPEEKKAADSKRPVIQGPVVTILPEDDPEPEPKNEPEPNDEEQDAFLPPSAQKIKYSGFMHIKCPECGAVKSFCMKQAADHYHCDSCKARSEFGDHMVPLWVHCECGGRHRYTTNRDDKSFDIECLDCGAPVAVEWNDKKKVYATIREK